MKGVPTQLGHVALRVRDLDRAVTFYSDVLGLTLHRRQEDKVAFLGARTDASHEIALFALPADAPGPDPARVGMYHMAWEMPSFDELQALHDRLLANNAQIAGYSDRQMNVMFLDPDGNELEAIWEPSDAEMDRLKAAGPLPRLRPS
ncbi:MAG TPA: VOC family protein [Chloroflexota bacterium]|jgi:catechol-2,3-dioxygenase|nr:VOC family protein [Chloroflexota bacterium]